MRSGALLTLYSLANEKEFLKSITKGIRRHIESRGELNLHTLSFITALLESGRDISDEDREYLEDYFWKIWTKTGSYDFWDGTSVDALYFYLNGMQGHIKKEVPFGNEQLKKRLGPFWKIAFGKTTEAFFKLDLNSLAVASQSLVKIELLKEALKKGVISDEFLNKMKDEFIPSLRVIEKICDIYPTLGVETKKEISSKDEYIAAAWESAIVNYLSAVQMPTALGKSYLEGTRAELRIPPGVYPILRRLTYEIKELLGIQPTLYHTAVAGDYSQKSRFLLSSFFFNATPPGSRFPINPDKDSYAEWAFPGYSDRYIGATIDPWTGKLLEIYDNKTQGTQTNFFHTAIEVTFDDKSVLTFYEEDIKRVFFITTAAAAFLNLYSIDDTELGEKFRQFQNDILEFYIQSLYISESDLNILTNYSRGRDFTYSDAMSEMFKVLRRISHGFIREPGDSPAIIARKTELHKKFQEITSKHVDLIETYLFPGEIGEAIKMAIKGDAISDVYQKIRMGAFNEDPRTQAKALDALKRAGDADFEKIKAATLSGEPSNPRTLSDSNRMYIPEVQSSAVPAAIDQDEAVRVHKENLAKYKPAIPEKTILCHIIADSILPYKQRSILQDLEKDMAGSNYIEKVVQLKINDSSDFIDELKKVMDAKRKKYEGYNVQFDVACPSTEIVRKVLDSALGVKALAFEPCKETEIAIIQVEGIILALRALNIDTIAGKIETLREAFKFLTGKELPHELLDVTDINEFIKRIIFTLPVTKVDYNSIEKLNEIIRKNIEAAA